MEEESVDTSANVSHIQTRLFTKQPQYGLEFIDTHIPCIIQIKD